MGIYLSNMEMPKNGSCIQIVIDDDGKVYPSVENCIFKMGPIGIAVPVPEHGRVIDVDALITDNAGKWTVYDLQRFANAPTIIQEDADEERREYDAQVEAAKYCEMYEPTYDPETGAM